MAAKDFTIYYLNFTKVYEMAMMINNVILTKIEKDNLKSFEETYGFTASLSAQGTKTFLDGIKSSISSETKETSFSSSKVVETLDVKTTKSILLRRIIEQCNPFKSFDGLAEGDLVKVDNVKLELLDEESLRQFLVLRRDALKGFRVEGMEVNNLINSVLQDYAYVLKGEITLSDGNTDEIIIKIPLDIQFEFENKYNINDLLIGHVSLVGVYKGMVDEKSISTNTYTYFQDAGSKTEEGKIIKSDTLPNSTKEKTTSNQNYHFMDILAVIQDVAFNLEEKPMKRIHWWNKIGLWLLNLKRG